MVYHRIETLGYDVKAKINDDWREWYINYNELLKLLHKANKSIKSTISNGGDLGRHGKSPASNRHITHPTQQAPSVSSLSTPSAPKLVNTAEKIRHCIVGKRPSPELAIPPTSSIRRRLQELLTPAASSSSTTSSPPRREQPQEAVQREVSLADLDVWLESQEHPELSRALSQPCIQDTSIQVP